MEGCLIALSSGAAKTSELHVIKQRSATADIVLEVRISALYGLIRLLICDIHIDEPYLHPFGE